MPEVHFFATRDAYSPIAGRNDVPNSGVLDIHKTKLNLSNPPYYSLGFVNAYNEYQAVRYAPADMIQHLARLLYTIRCNLVHGGKYFSQANNRKVVI